MCKQRCSDDNLAHWLALHRAPGLGSLGFRRLLERFANVREVFSASIAELRAVGVPETTLAFLRAPAWADVDADLAWAAMPGRHLLTLVDARYPQLLRQLVDAPPVLFLRGDPKPLQAPQVAIVGSRHPTATGREIAYEFAEALSRAGLVVTSGMAYGIDAAAHQGALAGSGVTIAVLGNGIDCTYPARHSALAERIAAAGVVVSEFPPGTPPLAAHFPRRNRIISGLSHGVVVVEAGRRSGSLITARLAAEQGREVFAVPGSIRNPLSRGCHALIREGATLVESAAEVLEILAAQIGELHPCDAGLQRDASVQDSELNADQRRVLRALGHEPTSVDVIVERSGLTAEAVSSMLLLLELRGHVLLAPGGLYCRAGARG